MTYKHKKNEHYALIKGYLLKGGSFRMPTFTTPTASHEPCSGRQPRRIKVGGGWKAKSAFGELTGFSDRYSYDVHLHPYYTLLDGSYTLETPSITDIIESHDRKSVVLGYKRIKDLSLTSGFRLQRLITIYSSEGVLVSIPFNDFLRTFKKIQKK